jgi:hypothetical protein
MYARRKNSKKQISRRASGGCEDSRYLHGAWRMLAREFQNLSVFFRGFRGHSPFHFSLLTSHLSHDLAANIR